MVDDPRGVGGGGDGGKMVRELDFCPVIGGGGVGMG